MSYTITLTDGTVFATIADGTINTTAAPALTLVGKNYSGYGQFLNTNFIRVLENSSNSTSPPAPITGQLWWNNSPGAGRLQVNTNDTTTSWKYLSAMAVGNTTPSSTIYNTQGDLWYDTQNQQVNIWSGTTWTLVGPQFTAGTGVTGAFANVITDTTGTVTHKVIELVVDSVVVGIMSGDATWTPLSAIPGFGNISSGIQLASNVTGIGGVTSPTFWGQGASGVNVAGNIVGGNINTAGLITVTGNVSSGNLRTTGSITAGSQFTGPGTGLTGTAASLTVGVASYANTAGQATNSTNVNGGTVTASTITATGFVSATGNVTGNYVLGNGALLTGVITSSANINNGTSNVTVVTSGGNVTVGIGGTSNVAVFSTTGMSIGNIVNANGNGIGNIGSSGGYFNTVFAQATSAQYADVAERFAADDVYEAGTVVELGGSAEITRSTVELSDTVFGVISTRAAYLMNSGAGSDLTHPPVAMTGRVPVQCTGVVRKGDRLVSAGNGIARAAIQGEATAFNTIGRALVDKHDTGLGLVEAIVTIK